MTVTRSSQTSLRSATAGPHHTQGLDGAPDHAGFHEVVLFSSVTAVRGPRSPARRCAYPTHLWAVAQLKVVIFTLPAGAERRCVGGAIHNVRTGALTFQ
jgi:hypothetical protein